MTAPAGGTQAETTIRALRGATAAEFRASFGYGLVGAALVADGAAAAQLDRARAGEADHATSAATGQALLAQLGTEALWPQADYPGLAPVAGIEAARRLAVQLEEECAQAWRYVLAEVAASSVGPGRTSETALDGLRESAIRAADWRGTPVPFPGM